MTPGGQNQIQTAPTAAWPSSAAIGPPVRKYVRVTAALIAVWLVMAWVMTARYVDWRGQQALGEAGQKIAEDMSDIATGLERNLVIFHGIPAIIARTEAVHRALAMPAPLLGTPKLSLGERRAQWPQVPTLAALNATLAESAKDIGALSVIWVMNPAGDCIAASNSASKDSFVGINYVDRAYFKAAQQGQLGRQFAVGRATKVPGLFFSAPVFIGERFVGVVAGKIDLPYLASWVNQANAFITDAYGVIIQAQDKTLEMRALPGASVRQLSAQERKGRYLRDELIELVIAPWPDSTYPGLQRLGVDRTPFLMATRAIPKEDLTVSVLQPVPALVTRQQDQQALFALAGALGALTLACIAAVLYYVASLQHARRHEAHQRQIEYLASHDPLTGLLSRAVIDQLIHQGIAIAARTGRRLGVLFLDMDMFKDINDSMGHEVGDLVLQEVANRLRGAVRASDPVVRHGGDEFVILLHDLESPDDAARLATQILLALRAPFTVQGVTLN